MFDLLNTIRRFINTYTSLNSPRRNSKRSAPVDESDCYFSTKMRRLSKPYSVNDEQYSPLTSDNSRKSFVKRFNHSYPTITLDDDDDDEDIVEIRDTFNKRISLQQESSTPTYTRINRNDGASSSYFGCNNSTSGTQKTVNGTGFLKTDKNLLKRSRGSTSTSRTPASKLSVIDLSFRLDEKLRYKELLERSSFHLDDDSHSFGKNFPSDYSRGRKMVDACKIRQKIFDVIDLTDDSSKRYNFKKSSSTAKAVKKVLDDFDNDAIVVKDSDSDIEIFTDPPSPKSDFKVERLNSLKSVVESCEFSKKKWLKDENEKLRKNSELVNKKLDELEGCRRQLRSINSEIEQKCIDKLVRDSLNIKDCYIIPEFEKDEDVPLPKLTSEQEALVKKAFTSSRGELIVTKFNLNIYVEDMRTLAGLNWLNDNIINFYMNLIIERAKDDKFPKAYAFNTFFYSKLIKDGYTPLRRWTKKIDLFSYDIVAVPVHLQMHWCMAIIDFRTKSITYYDSMGSANRKCLEALQGYLKSEHMDKKGCEFDMSGWQLESASSDKIPQQMNGSDCGVFSCTFAEFITRNANLSFQQEDMPYLRIKMAYEIITGKLMIS